MADLLIKGGTIVTVDKDRKVIKNGVLVTEGNRIKFIGPRGNVKKKYKAEKVINAEGKTIFPGFINAHAHMFQVLLRNLAVDMPLLRWLDKVIYPAISS